MSHAADPLADRERLLEIAALDLTSPEVDRLLQELTARAAEHFELPKAMVSVVLDEAQYFAAMHGVEGWMAEARGTPVEWSFCQHTVRAAAPFVVEDADVDPVMRDSPLARLEGQRCYAGVPMVSSRGHVLGSFCVTGPERRSFSDGDIERLRDFAREAVERIEARRTPAG